MKGRAGPCVGTDLESLTLVINTVSQSTLAVANIMGVVTATVAPAGAVQPMQRNPGAPWVLEVVK